MRTLINPKMPEAAIIEECNHKSEDECGSAGCWFDGNLAASCKICYWEDNPATHDECRVGWCECLCHGSRKEELTRVGHFWKNLDNDEVFILIQAYKDGRYYLIQLVSLKTGKPISGAGSKFMVKNPDSITEWEFGWITRGYDLEQIFLQEKK